MIGSAGFHPTSVRAQRTQANVAAGNTTQKAGGPLKLNIERVRMLRRSLVQSPTGFTKPTGQPTTSVRTATGGATPSFASKPTMAKPQDVNVGALQRHSQPAAADQSAVSLESSSVSANHAVDGRELVSTSAVNAADVSNVGDAFIASTTTTGDFSGTEAFESSKGGLSEIPLVKSRFGHTRSSRLQRLDGHMKSFNSSITSGKPNLSALKNAIESYMTWMSGTEENSKAKGDYNEFRSREAMSGYPVLNGLLEAANRLDIDIEISPKSAKRYAGALVSMTRGDGKFSDKMESEYTNLAENLTMDDVVRTLNVKQSKYKTAQVKSSVKRVIKHTLVAGALTVATTVGGGLYLAGVGIRGAYRSRSDEGIMKSPAHAFLTQAGRTTFLL